jgi:hypothetical protein
VHCTQTAGSADVKVQNTLHGRNNVTCGTDCKYRTAGTLFIPEGQGLLGCVIVNSTREGDDRDNNIKNNKSSDSNIIYGSNSKVTVTKSKKT